jgi:hypothetical protein
MAHSRRVESAYRVAQLKNDASSPSPLPSHKPSDVPSSPKMTATLPTRAPVRGRETSFPARCTIFSSDAP